MSDHEHFQSILMSPTSSSLNHNAPSATQYNYHNRKSGVTAVELVRRYIESLPQHLPFKTEVRSVHLWKAVWTEFIGTMLFVVIGCGSGIRWYPSDASIPGVSEDLKASLAIGCTMAALVHSAAHISGCHLNPAVSITLLVTRNITPLRTATYALAQCLGAVVGAAVLYGLSPSDIRQSGLPVTVLRPNIHPSQAFGVEFLITLLVIITLIATYEMQSSETGLKGMSVGVAYTVGHLFGYRYTGASMNPARSFGLALISNTWANQWVYWVGPILGGIIGGITYEYIRSGKNANGYICADQTSVTQPMQARCQPPPHQSTAVTAEVNGGGELRRDQSGFSCCSTDCANDYRI